MSLASSAGAKSPPVMGKRPWLPDFEEESLLEFLSDDSLLPDSKEPAEED